MEEKSAPPLCGLPVNEKGVSVLKLQSRSKTSLHFPYIFTVFQFTLLSTSENRAQRNHIAVPRQRHTLYRLVSRTNFSRTGFGYPSTTLSWLDGIQRRAWTGGLAISSTRVLCTETRYILLLQNLQDVE